MRKREHAGAREPVDEIVERILAQFDIDLTAGRAWRGTLAELRRVLCADYDEPVARYFASGDFPVAELVRSAQKHFPNFNREPLSFRPALAYTRDRQRGLGLNVMESPFGRRGHPLRGFYHRAAKKRPVIWLNCQHTETAVGATFAHELGHHFWEQVADHHAGSTSTLQHDGFAAHLGDARELFADAFTALGGYPRATARRLFVRAGWSAPQSEDALRTTAALTRIERHIHRHYPGELGGRSGLPAGLRLYYLGSLIHFSRLRAAILGVAGL